MFAAGMAECGAALAECVDWPVVDVLRGVEGAPDVSRVDVVQPVLWAVMVGFGGVWRSLGVVPSAVAGHSQGEIAAAAVVGALSLGDAARVVAVRSRLLASGWRDVGGWCRWDLPAGVVEELVGGWGVSVAAVNGPGRRWCRVRWWGWRGWWRGASGRGCGAAGGCGLRVALGGGGGGARRSCWAGLAAISPRVWGCRSIRR